jgi:hypothetical protein
MITARHVVESAAAGDGTVYLRANVRDGGTAWVGIPFASWEMHADPAVDLAAAETEWGSDDFDVFEHALYRTHDCLTPDDMLHLGIRPGAPIFIPGLFVRNPGDSKNIPIIRTGTIAAIPDEKSRIKTGSTYVYLAELRSIGGHSGSPVFVYPELDQVLAMSERKKLGNPEILLLGVIHGHFPLRPDEFSASVIGDSSTPSSTRYGEDFNSGIAVIIPAIEIVSVLNQKRFVDHRAISCEKFLSNSGGTVADGANPAG